MPSSAKRGEETSESPATESETMSSREETKESEPQSAAEAYRLLFDQSGEMVCILDLEGRLTSVNPAGERLTGYPATEIVGRLAVELIAPELREQAAHQFQERLRGDAGAQRDSARHT